MTDVEFENIVQEALGTLPERFRRALKNVAIVIEDDPSLEQRRRIRLHPRSVLFGLYEGIPPSERAIRGQPILPDKITIFRNSLLRFYTNHADLVREIRVTVWHELGHYFGLPEKDLPPLERRWRRKTRALEKPLDKP